MDLDIVILTELSQTEKDKTYNITYLWNLRNGTNEPIYKTEIESPMWKTNLWLQRGKGGGGIN